MKIQTSICFLSMCALALFPCIAQSIETLPATQAAELKQLKINNAILLAEKKQLVSKRLELEEQLDALQNRLGHENAALEHQLKLLSSEKVGLMSQVDELDKKLRQIQKENEVSTADLLADLSASKSSRDNKDKWASDNQELEKKLSILQKKLEEQHNKAQAAENRLQQTQVALANAFELGRSTEKLLRKVNAEKTSLTQQVNKLTAANNGLMVQLDKLGDELKIAQNNQPQTGAVPQPPLEVKTNSLESSEAIKEKPVASESTQVVSGIKKALTGWSKAWSEQNVEGYLSFYSPDFQPPASRGRAEWEQQRRSRLKRPKFITITLMDIKIDVINSTSSRVQFIQSFKSNTYADTVSKQLEMKKEDDGWKILSEDKVK